MKNINEFNKYKIKELDMTLKKNYMVALKDPNFEKLCNSLDVSEDRLIHYTSKLEDTVKELNNCKCCKGLSHCKNKVKGCVSYPKIDNDNLIFTYRECKKNKQNNNNVVYFETSKLLREAKMSDIYLDDKKRVKIIKYIKDFIDNYKKGNKTKGLYLYGSFGSGKSYLMNALLNELSKYNYKCVSIYYPSLLRKLKDGFGSNFEERLDEIMKCDILLLDDIGAENNTQWGRDEVLGSILQYRMDNALSTFFTSNFNLEELENHLKSTTNNVDQIKARRIIERIKFLSESMELIGENRR